MRRLGSFLTFFIPFLVFFFYFTNQNSHNHSAADTLKHDMTHGYAEIPAGYEVPSVKAAVIRDLSGSWLLKVETDHFTLAREKAGMSERSYNKGHAHIYINGKKLIDYMENTIIWVR